MSCEEREELFVSGEEMGHFGGGPGREGYDFGGEDEKNGVFFSPERVLRLERREKP